MEGMTLLLAVAALGVDFGWQPSTQHQGDLDYVIQLEPGLLEQLERGEVIINDIPPDVRGGRRFVLRVGAGNVPRQGTPLRQQNIPFGTTGLRSGVGSVPAVVMRQGEPIPWNNPTPAATPTAPQPAGHPQANPTWPAPPPAVVPSPRLLEPEVGGVNPAAFPGPAGVEPRPGVTVIPQEQPAPPPFRTNPPAIGQPQTPLGAAPAFPQPVPDNQRFAPAANPADPSAWPDPNVGVANVPQPAGPRMTPQPQAAPPAIEDWWLGGSNRDGWQTNPPTTPPRIELEAPRNDLVAPRTDWNTPPATPAWPAPGAQPGGARLDPNLVRVDPRLDPRAVPPWDRPLDPAAVPRGPDRATSYPPIPYSPYDPRYATPTSYVDPTARVGLSKVVETAKDAQLTSATALAASAASPVTRVRQEAVEKPQPWTPLLLTAVGLFLSIGGNMYLGWIWSDSQRRYLGLIHEMRTARV